MYLAYLAPGATDTRLVYSILKYAFGRLIVGTASLLLVLVRVSAYPWHMGYDLKIVKGSREKGEIKYTVHIPGVNDDECEGVERSETSTSEPSNTTKRKGSKKQKAA